MAYLILMAETPVRSIARHRSARQLISGTVFLRRSSTTTLNAYGTSHTAEDISLSLSLIIRNILCVRIESGALLMADKRDSDRDPPLSFWPRNTTDRITIGGLASRHLDEKMTYY